MDTDVHSYRIRDGQTSVDQLTWDHPLLRDLERAGAAAGVPSHSFIAALREPSAEGATDGLVPVASARLGGARSEVVVRAHHVCFQHPEVIREVRRVLGEHAAGPARPPRPGPGGSPPVGAQLVTLRRPAASPNRMPTGDSSRPTLEEVVPE